MSKSHHISDVRAALIEQLQALRSAKPTDLDAELRRAKGVSEVAQVIVNSAKVEVDYIMAVKGASDSPFLQAEDEGGTPVIPSTPQGHFSGLGERPGPADPARLGGPSANHPWRGKARQS